MSVAEAGPLIFLVAGEPSGDVLGARLMAAFKARSPAPPRFAGVGGERMTAEGLDSLFPMSELSIMGYLEVVLKIPRVLARVRETAAAARQVRPDAVITIDAPDFSFRVARRLAGAGIPLIHYVAPQVWAHRPGRSAKIAEFLDHLLAILPFEPPYFEDVGLPCSFVGHAIVEEDADKGDGERFRASHGVLPEAPLVCVLPGSRRGEVSRHLPIFGATLGLLAARYPGLSAVVPTMTSVADEVTSACADWPVAAHVIVGRDEKYDAIAASRVALAASGTVALELAIAGTPMVIAYKTNALTAWLARRMVRVPYACLINLILDSPVVPEFIQEDCRPVLLAEAVAALYDDGDARAAQIASGRHVAESLGLGGVQPSDRAADTVLKVIAQGPRVR